MKLYLFHDDIEQFLVAANDREDAFNVIEEAYGPEAADELIMSKLVQYQDHAVVTADGKMARDLAATGRGIKDHRCEYQKFYQPPKPHPTHEIFEKLRQSADVVLTWSFTSVLGNTLSERYTSLERTIRDLSMAFTIKFDRVPTMIAAFPEVMSIIETSDGVEAQYESLDDKITYVGKHRGYDLYKDSWFAMNSLIVTDGERALAMKVEGLAL